MVGSWKVIAAAMKARKTWQRIPPDRRRQMLEQAGQQARKHGPVVAQKVKTQAPVVAAKVREQAPAVAERLRKALDPARTKPPKQE